MARYKENNEFAGDIEYDVSRLTEYIDTPHNINDVVMAATRACIANSNAIDALNDEIKRLNDRLDSFPIGDGS